MIPLVIVDAFSHRPFSGNPAAICLLKEPAEDAWMQSLAAEMNLSETAFLLREGKSWRLRWFTPKFEVDLCGHATLAAAHCLWERGNEDSANEIYFETRSGRLSAARDGETIWLGFPAVHAEECAPPDGLIESLGVRAQFVGRNAFDYLIQIDNANNLRDLSPDFGRLEQVEARGVIVTSESDVAEFDFLSRFFAPRAGVNEDPVTGSAHCCLSGFWSNRLGKTRMTAFQASARGGVVQLNDQGDRVGLGGPAVTVLEGTLKI